MISEVSPCICMPGFCDLCSLKIIMLDIKRILVFMTEAYLTHMASYLVRWVLWSMAWRMQESLGCVVGLSPVDWVSLKVDYEAHSSGSNTQLDPKYNHFCLGLNCKVPFHQWEKKQFLDMFINLLRCRRPICFKEKWLYRSYIIIYLHDKATLSTLEVFKGKAETRQKETKAVKPTTQNSYSPTAQVKSYFKRDRVDKGFRYSRSSQTYCFKQYELILIWLKFSTKKNKLKWNGRLCWTNILPMDAKRRRPLP